MIETEGDSIRIRSYKSLSGTTPYVQDSARPGQRRRKDMSRVAWIECDSQLFTMVELIHSAASATGSSIPVGRTLTNSRSAP
jgi:hypothetical protein